MPDQGSSTAQARADFTAKVCKAIRQGQLDNHLEIIVNAINGRRVVIRDTKMDHNVLELGTPGTRVRISGNIRPKYMSGYTGTVISTSESAMAVKPGFLVVRLDAGEIRRGRKTWSGIINVPASSLEAE